MTNQLTWIPFYEELANRLLSFSDDMPGLIAVVEEMKAAGLAGVPGLVDQFPDGKEGLVRELDPFTFFAFFNRGMLISKRIAICEWLTDRFSLTNAPPTDFSGIPLGRNEKLWFFPWAKARKADDIPALWKLATQAISANSKDVAPSIFTRVLAITNVGWTKLTVGLFWLQPHKFLPLDVNTRKYCEAQGVDIVLDGKNATIHSYSDYLQIMNEVGSKIGDFAQIAFDAYQGTNGGKGGPEPIMKKSISPHAPPEPLNTILYGPPGTGKTYQTVMRAVQIIEPAFNGSHAEAKERFDELLQDGRIEFITFHQSYSYEDFVEGIRPTVIDDEDEGGQARYILADGVFKRIALRALGESLRFQSRSTGTAPFSETWQRLLDDIEANPDTKYPGLKGRTVYVLTVSPRGNVTGKNVAAGTSTYHANRKVMEQLFARCGDCPTITTREVQKTFDRGMHDHFVALVFNHMKSLERELVSEKRTFPVITDFPAAARSFLDQPSGDYRLRGDAPVFVLIIDEVNRGNISKVFGELITLIEDDKRIGRANQLTATLPYSGQPFGTPANLHIIGTMNTSDKSIALVDMALRRRFEFEELRASFETDTCPGLDANMRRVLDELNRRLAAVKDRDHQIGHAYFSDVDSPESFSRVFKKKVVPLLQEFFYNDWDGLRSVLGESGNISRFIKKVNNDGILRARTHWQWSFDVDSNDPAECAAALQDNYWPSLPNTNLGDEQ